VLYRIWPAFALEIAFVLYDLKPKSQKGHAYVFALFFFISTDVPYLSAEL